MFAIISILYIWSHERSSCLFTKSVYLSIFSLNSLNDFILDYERPGDEMCLRRMKKTTSPPPPFLLLY